MSATAEIRSVKRRAFVEDDSGVALVEMALIMPVALLMLSLAMMGGQAFTAQTKVVLAAHTVTDLVSQTPYLKSPTVSGATQLNQSDLDTDLALASEVMYPFGSANMQVVVTELSVNATNQIGTVVWSEGYNGGTPATVGAQVTLSPAVTAAGASYLIYGQVTYSFQPFGVYLRAATLNLTASEMLTPRNAGQIAINWGS
jgi:Flp pilus assembly protein TadG